MAFNKIGKLFFKCFFYLLQTTAVGRMGIVSSTMDPAALDTIDEDILELKVFFRTLWTDNIEEERKYMVILFSFEPKV